MIGGQGSRWPHGQFVITVMSELCIYLAFGGSTSLIGTVHNRVLEDCIWPQLYSTELNDLNLIPHL